MWRAFVRLVTRYRILRSPPALNLLAPPLLAELHVRVFPDGEHQLHGSKLDDPTPETIVRIARALITSGVNFASSYGIRVEIKEAGRE